jgi:tRNA-specific 2-thiouridylase
VRLGLAVAEKPDSQDICFVPSGNYAELVAKLRPEATGPGDILSRDGRVLGRHQGVFRYTVGQAKRLGDARVDQGVPQVVVELDPASRRVIVGPHDAGATRIGLRETNWLAAPAGGAAFRCQVKLRARDVLRPASVLPLPDGRAQVTLDEPALPAPGQGCAMYDGDRVLGGGFIEGGKGKR